MVTARNMPRNTTNSSGKRRYIDAVYIYNGTIHFCAHEHRGVIAPFYECPAKTSRFRGGSTIRPLISKILRGIVKSCIEILMFEITTRLSLELTIKVPIFLSLFFYYKYFNMSVYYSYGI